MKTVQRFFNCYIRTLVWRCGSNAHIVAYNIDKLSVHGLKLAALHSAYIIIMITMNINNKNDSGLSLCFRDRSGSRIVQ